MSGQNEIFYEQSLIIVAIKPRRGEKFSGGECLRRGIFPLVGEDLAGKI